MIETLFIRFSLFISTFLYLPSIFDKSIKTDLVVGCRDLLYRIFSWRLEKLGLGHSVAMMPNR